MPFKALFKTRAMRAFMAAILAMGILRFVLTVSGVPDSIVKYFSMTVIIGIASIYFAVTTQSHLERFQASYLVILPYLIVEVAALAYTWGSGHATIFHSPEYSFGLPIALHTAGHFVGGLTWEPWSLFVVMELIWLARAGIRKVFG